MANAAETQVNGASQHGGAWRRRVLRQVALCLLASAASACAALVWWIYDTRDLAAVRAKAATRGVPVEWGGAGFAASGPEALDAWMTASALLEKLPPFGGQAGRGRPGVDIDYFQPFQPLPAGAAEHYAALDQAVLRGLLRSVDQLPWAVVTGASEWGFADRDIPAARNRRIVRLLRDCVLLAPPAAAGEATRRLVHFVATMPPLPFPSAMQRYDAEESTLAVVAERMADLKVDGAGLADDLERLAQQVVVNQRQVARAVFIMTLEAAPGGLQRVRGGHQFTFSSWPAACAPLLERSGRGAALDSWLDGIAILDRVGSGSDSTWAWLAFSRARSRERWRVHGAAQDILSAMTEAFWPSETLPEEVALHARLLAAELRGSAWPADTLSPGEPPLRRLLRNGTVVGAYSLNPSQNAQLEDREGKSPNRYFAVYGPRKEPTTAP